MLRTLLLLATTATSVVLFAQSQTTNPPAQAATMTQPSAPEVIVAPAGPSIYVLGGGLYGTGVFVQSPGTLPLQATGISLAGRAGVSLETVLQPGIVTGLTTLVSGAAMYSAPEAAAGETGRAIYDLGPSYYVGAIDYLGVVETPVLSLGEVAAAYKRSPRRAVKTYTNADAERLSKP